MQSADGAERQRVVLRVALPAADASGEKTVGFETIRQQAADERRERRPEHDARVGLAMEAFRDVGRQRHAAP